MILSHRLWKSEIEQQPPESSAATSPLAGKAQRPWWKFCPRTSSFPTWQPEPDLYVPAGMRHRYESSNYQLPVSVYVVPTIAQLFATA